MRTHEGLLAQTDKVQSSPTKSDADCLAREYGIKGTPLLSYLSSILFPSSFPYDFMHLIWKNLVKNLVQHWTGEFKGLNDGTESYQLSETVWKAIGQAIAISGSTIPSVYGSHVPNIASDRSYYSAEMWSFWTLYLGPVLLQH